MTRFGAGAALVGVLLLVGGLVAHWYPVVVIGAGVVILVAGSIAHVLRRPRLALERAVEPPRVEKGLPAIAVVHVTNVSRAHPGADCHRAATRRHADSGSAPSAASR